LQDYLAAPTTTDLAYGVILEHTIAERERRWVCHFFLFHSLRSQLIFFCFAHRNEWHGILFSFNALDGIRETGMVNISWERNEIDVLSCLYKYE
jgi:hypothetical protein